MSDPFTITGPAIISVSGGRTSGYMLWRILQAHGGVLPPDVHAVFDNTGREMPATLDFVQAMASSWGVHITWLEFTGRRADGYAVVSHNSAARDGEPFDAFLQNARTLPNPVQSSCTHELKIRTTKRWVMRELGWRHWTNVIGLRADEKQRVQNIIDNPPRERFSISMPLAQAGASKTDVNEFWKRQPFDLMLAGPWEGNCDGCFKKSRASILRMHADHPERMKWWAQSEAVPRGEGAGNRFRDDRESYQGLAKWVVENPRLPIDEGLVEGIEGCAGGCGI